MIKKTIKELEENENCKISHEHACDKNVFHNDIRIYYMTEAEGIQQDQWMLLAMTIADDKWVNDGEADYIGEIINSRSFKIHFAPFVALN